MKKPASLKKSILIVFLTLALPLSLSAQKTAMPFAENLPQEKQKLLNDFTALETNEAREFMRRMSSNDLIEIWQAYTQNKPLIEKRLTWLIEEYYMRQANKVAEERLVFLFAGVMLMILLIAAMMFIVYHKQKNLEKMIE